MEGTFDVVQYLFCLEPPLAHLRRLVLRTLPLAVGDAREQLLPARPAQNDAFLARRIERLGVTKCLHKRANCTTFPLSFTYGTGGARGKAGCCCKTRWGMGQPVCHNSPQNTDCKFTEVRPADPSIAHGELADPCSNILLIVYYNNDTFFRAADEIISILCAAKPPPVLSRRGMDCTVNFMWSAYKINPRSLAKNMLMCVCARAPS